MGTRFWTNMSVGKQPPCCTFPRVFTFSNQKEMLVGELSTRREGQSSWSLSWWRVLFLWEEEFVTNLLALVNGFRGLVEDDCWRWLPEDGGILGKVLLYFIGESLFIRWRGEL